MSVMDIMLSSSATEQTRDLAMAIAAIDRKRPATGEPTDASGARSGKRAARVASTPTRRALAIGALGALLIAGVTVLTSSSTSHSGTASAAATSSVVFDEAGSGDCLSWPKNSPDQAHFVRCDAPHLFEVAESVDMRDSQQPCQLAVQRYLGARYDPDGKFTIAVLWPGATAGPRSGGHLLCGLQWSGPGNEPIAFAGKVAELDQSKVWPAGTCLGIEPASNQATGIPVDCSAPHAQEITGAVNLADVWPDAAPSQADQDTFVRDACTQETNAYLAPIELHTTGLTLIYRTVPLPSWLAGSRQASCGIGAPLGDGGTATLAGSAKGRLLINGVAPAERPRLADARPAAPAEPSTAPSTPATVASPSQTSPVPRTSVSPSPAATPPAPSESPSPSASPDPDAGPVIEIPGFPPITLPRLLPPEPPPPGT